MLHCKKRLIFLEAEQLWSVLQIGVVEVFATHLCCGAQHPFQPPEGPILGAGSQARSPGNPPPPKPRDCTPCILCVCSKPEACQILRIMQGASLITSTSNQAHAVSALYLHCAQVAFPRSVHPASQHSPPPCSKPSGVECAEPIGKGQNAQV